MFAIRCYGFPGHPFTHFREGYKTAIAAKKAADHKLVEGWRMVEVLKRETLTDWKLIKTIRR